MSQALRGDDARLFGQGGRVRAARLFPLPASYTPGLRVMRGGQEMNELYDQLAELLVLPDALEPTSDTHRRIVDIEQKLSRIEKEEAAELQTAFEATLLMPLDAGARLAQAIAEALHDNDDPAAGNPAPDQP